MFIQPVTIRRIEALRVVGRMSGEFHFGRILHDQRHGMLAPAALRGLPMWLQNLFGRDRGIVEKTIPMIETLHPSQAALLLASGLTAGVGGFRQVGTLQPPDAAIQRETGNGPASTRLDRSPDLPFRIASEQQFCDSRELDV